MNVFGFGKKQSELTGTEWLSRGALYALGSYLESKEDKDNNPGGAELGGMAPGVSAQDPFQASAGYKPVQSIMGGNFRLM